MIFKELTFYLFKFSKFTQLICTQLQMILFDKTFQLSVIKKF